MGLYALARHAQTTFNVEGRVNGDPWIPVPLTELGREEARRLGSQLAELPIELCVHSRFARTRETAIEALRDRDIPFVEEPLLDDIHVGELEGHTLADYRAWKASHQRSDPFPGGESLDDATRRYARAFANLVGRSERTILVVCHEIPVRYALNAAAGSDDLDAPAHTIANATPYLFDDESLARAAKRMKEMSAE